MYVSDKKQSVGQLLEKAVSTGFVYQFDPRRNCYPRDQSEATNPPFTFILLNNQSL